MARKAFGYPGRGPAAFHIGHRSTGFRLQPPTSRLDWHS